MPKIIKVVLAIILLIIILVIVYVLLTPINIYIDTRKNQYYAELKGLAMASIEADELELFRIRLKVPFREFYFFPFKARPTPKKAVDEKKPKKGSKGKKRMTPGTMIRVLRSFKIKKWDLDLDTGDCVTNAKLYPIFAFMNYRYGGFHVNFEGRNHALLQVQNRPIYIIKSIINF